jgi:SAM-dependent methyltransferase
MGNNVKESVKKHYGDIAKSVNGKSQKASCCGPSCCSSSCCGDVGITSNLYNIEYLKGLPEDAVNASLGCANPISFADLKEGETVLDLGSGGGIDVFIASKYVGLKGKVYGLDMTDEMLKLANRNKEKMGIENVEFIKGYIENIPLEDSTINAIISNCVINLSEDKGKVMQEAYRVLKSNGRIAIADIVMLKDVPEAVRKSVEMWVGCVAGALNINEYRSILEKAGFKNIEIKPVNVYSKDIIEGVVGLEELQRLTRGIEIDLIDGAFAGSQITACKGE